MVRAMDYVRAMGKIVFLFGNDNLGTRTVRDCVRVWFTIKVRGHVR